MLEGVEVRIVRTLAEAIAILIEENFDGFVTEGETPIATAQATNARQHFPSLKILCLVPNRVDNDQVGLAEQQDIKVLVAGRGRRPPAYEKKLFLWGAAPPGG